MPIVSVQPDGKLLGPAIGCWIGLSVGPLSERGLDEALGLAVGFGSVGPGADVLDPEFSAGVAEVDGSVARAIVGHHALDDDAEACKVGDCSLEEGHGALFAFVRLDLGAREFALPDVAL